MGRATVAALRARGLPVVATDLGSKANREHAASLLPNEVRGAFVWTFRLDARGEVVETSLERARVRSRRQLSYEQADAELAAGAGESIETLRLLLELGELRLALEAERGGASLSTPEILVAHDGERYTLERRALHAIGYEGAIDYDHIMKLATDGPEGREYMAFCVGQMKGFLQALAG